ncbi:hemerythrin domain-containing protein [Jeotgalicoccus huakuii]|nr:hemerythrin domain-containing protein [Jeotgalicoccus huakuii]
MSNINETMKLKDICFKVPAAGTIFRELNIDFVTEGDRTLKEAHEEGQFDLENILYELNNLKNQPKEGIDVSFMDQVSIIKYIERKYYDDLLDELPVLNDYVEKLGKKYKKNHPEYEKVSELFYNIYREMIVHIELEKSDVYPLLKTYYEDDSKVAFEALKPHITRLIDAHKNIVNWFEQINKLTNGYTPIDANEPLNVFVLRKLEENEENIMMLLHLENNLLFTPFR